MTNNLLYQIALTLIPNIGCVQAKILIEHYGNAQDIFKARKKELGAIENIGLIRASNIKAFEDFTAVAVRSIAMRNAQMPKTTPLEFVNQ